MYKSASDKEILEWLDKSRAFEYNGFTEYQSELSHRLKTYGAEFVSIYGTAKEYEFALSLGSHCALYLHTLIKYLADKLGVDFGTLEISSFEPVKMEFLLLADGTVLEYDVVGDIDIVKEDIEDSLDEFLSVGLSVSSDDIYGAV